MALSIHSKERRFYTIQYDERLRIDRPYLRIDYDRLTISEQEEFELVCQKICAQILDRIKDFEQEYMERYQLLKEINDDDQFYEISEEMIDFSSRLCDLNLLFLQIEGKYISQSLG